MNTSTLLPTRRRWLRWAASGMAGTVVATTLALAAATPAGAMDYPGWIPFVDVANGAAPPIVPEALPQTGPVTYPSTYKNGMICRSSISNPGKPFLEISSGAVVWTRCYVQKPQGMVPTAVYSGYSIVDQPGVFSLQSWGGGYGWGALDCLPGPNDDQAAGRLEVKCTVQPGDWIEGANGKHSATMHSYAADGFAVASNRVRLVTQSQYSMGAPGSLRLSVGGGDAATQVVSPPHPWNEAYWFDSAVQPPPWPDWWPAGTSTLGSTDANPNWPTDPGESPWV